MQFALCNKNILYYLWLHKKTDISDSLHIGLSF